MFRLQVVNMEQKQVIEELEASLNKLAKSKHKASKQLKTVQDKMESTTKGSLEETEKQKELVSQLRKELETAKDFLKESNNREKQVSKRELSS